MLLDTVPSRSPERNDPKQFANGWLASGQVAMGPRFAREQRREPFVDVYPFSPSNTIALEWC
jgi:hypothetical protein